MTTDEDLYLQLQAGTEAAFTELYERYERPLFGFIQRRISNRQDAEEIFQETMLSLLKSSELTFSSGGVAAWLYRVASNRISHSLRSRAIREQKLTELRHDQSSPLRVLPDEELAERQENQRLVSAAQKLKPRHAEIYSLWIDGHSYEAMAKQLGLPLGTVKSRIHHLVYKLQWELKRWTAK